METILTLACFLNYQKQLKRNNKWKGGVLLEFYPPLQYFLTQYTTNNLRHEKPEHVLSRLGFSIFSLSIPHMIFNADIQKAFRSIFLVFLLPQSSNQVQPNTKLFHFRVVPGAQCALKLLIITDSSTARGTQGAISERCSVLLPWALLLQSNEPDQHKHKIQLLITVLTSF